MRTDQPLLQAASGRLFFSAWPDRLRSFPVPEPPVFFVFAGGRQLGPIRFAEMADLAARGILQADDLAWKSGTPDWVPASQLLAFPGRKPLSGVFEIQAAAPQDAGPEGRTLPRPDEPVPAAAPGSRQAPALASSEGWPRVSLAKASDDPGLGLLESGAEVGTGSADSAASGGAEARTPEPAGRLGRLLPLRRLNDDLVLGSPVTWALVFFGLGPLFVSAVAEDSLLRIRLFDFGCGALWVVFFYAAFRTESSTSRAVLAVFFGTLLFAALYLGLLAGWPPVSTLAPWTAAGQGFGLRFVAGLGGTALVQEAGKLLIVFFVARPMRELDTAADGLFFGLVAGAAFGLCVTVVQAWPLGNGGEGLLRSGGDGTTTALYAAFLGRAVRAMTQPFLHAVWTAVAGTLLVRGFPPEGRKAAPGRAALGLGLAIALHALYESLTPRPTALLSVLVAAAGLLLLLALRRDAEEEPILTALR